MLILAIDPGPENSAYCLCEIDPRVGLKIFQKDITANRHVRALLTKVPGIDNCKVVIEMVASYGMPVGKEVFETCVEIGRFVECSAGFARFLTRKQVVTHLCGAAQASDANIRQALIDRFGKPGTKKAPGILYGFKYDMWSALAIAVAFAELNSS